MKPFVGLLGWKILIQITSNYDLLLWKHVWNPTCFNLDNYKFKKQPLTYKMKKAIKIFLNSFWDAHKDLANANYTSVQLKGRFKEAQ